MYDTLENGDPAFNLDYVTQGNCVTITLAEQVLNVSGKVDLTITFLSTNEEVISAFPMILDVAENPGTVATQESKDYFSLSVAIDAAVKATQEMFESKALIFEIDKDENGTYVFVGDVSYEDLETAFDNGKVVFCRVKDPDIILSLFGISDGIFNFYAMSENIVYSLTINANGEIQLKYTPLATGEAVQNLEKASKQHTIQLNAQQNAIDSNSERLTRVESLGSGVYVGAEPPENPNVEVWINPDAGTSFQDAAAYDESIEVSEVSESVTLNLPCPVSDFEILQIHLTTKQAQFKLNMDVGGKSTFLANTQGGNSAGVHVLLMSTHDPDVMNLNVQTASYTENAWPSVPDRIAEVNKDAASIMLYTEDAGGGFQTGTTIHAWGVYKASGSAVLQIKDQETGEWKSLKTLRGENGKDGADYILTEEDKQEIAGKVEVPEPPSDEWELVRSDTLEQDVRELFLDIGEDWNEVFVIITGRTNNAANSLTTGTTSGYIDLMRPNYSYTRVVNGAALFFPRAEAVFPTTVHLRRLAEVTRSEVLLYGSTYYGTQNAYHVGGGRGNFTSIKIWFGSSDVFLKAGAKVEVWSK